MKIKTLFIVFIAVISLTCCAFAEELNVPILETNWVAEFHDQGAKASLKIDDTQGAPVVVLDWDLGPAMWAQAVDRLEVDASAYDTIVFSIRGEGDRNRLTLKLSDRDGSFFGADIMATSGDAEWKEIRIPINSLKYFWGSDNVLDQKNISRIFIAVERSKGGKGILYIKGLKFVQAATPQVPQQPQAVQ